VLSKIYEKQEWLRPVLKAVQVCGDSVLIEIGVIEKGNM
jgi:hypothetical protein